MLRLGLFSLQLGIVSSTLSWLYFPSCSSIILSNAIVCTVGLLLVVLCKGNAPPSEVMLQMPVQCIPTAHL